MSRLDLVAILVHHRTPERILPSVTALRRQASDAGCSMRVVVVDQSGEAPDGDGWLTLRPIDNLGYAGGFNAAVRAAGHAGYYMLMNPDVVLDAGALGRLVEHAQPRGAVGPMLFWDTNFRLVQPPTREPEAPRWLRAVHDVLPLRAARMRRRRWRAQARRHWRAVRPLPTRHLSGACLLIGRAAIDRVGPMDERFRLYYEETDWLRRLWATGGRSFLVPAARGVHEFDASARQEERRDEWFARSEALYRRRYAVGADLPTRDADLPPWNGSARVRAPVIWVELSPFADGVPATAERIELGEPGLLRWSPPAEVADRVAGFSLTLVDETGAERGRYRLDPACRGGSE